MTFLFVLEDALEPQANFFEEGVVALPQEERLTVGSMKVGEGCLIIPEPSTSADLEEIPLQGGR